MAKRSVSHFLHIPLMILVLALFLTTASPAYLHPKKCTNAQTVVNVESLGLVTFPTGYMFADTEVGGLSGIAYDSHRGVYYALADERTDAHFYTVDIDLSDGSLDPGDVLSKE